MTLVLHLHAAATLFMAGLIWFVQLVHYPLFGAVGPQGFTTYAAEHARRTTWIVAPVMLAELATAAWLLLARPGPLAWIGAGLLGVIWISTAFLQVPRHSDLQRGFEPRAHRLLVATNWIRTAGWTARGVLALAIL